MQVCRNAAGWRVPVSGGVAANTHLLSRCTHRGGSHHPSANISITGYKRIVTSIFIS